MDGTVNLLIMLVFIFMFVLMLSVPRRSSVPICMARRPILARLFHINNSIFMLTLVIICGNSCTNSAPHCTTNNSALATTDFRTNGNPDAAAKAGDKGGAVGGEILLDGVTIYQLTENGLALQATLKGTKYWKDSELN